MTSTWERLAGHDGGTVASLAAATSATGDRLIFAATPVGVHHSTDSGRSWTLPGVKPTVPFADIVVASPRFAKDHTLFVCGADGLYRSSDAGHSWERVLVGSRMLSVVVSPGETLDRLVLLAGTETDGILRSEDSGRTWTGANAGLMDLTAISLAVSPCFDTDRTGFAGTASGLHRTRNGGRSWRSVETGLDEPAVQCLAVSPDFSNDRLVLAGTEAHGLLRSTDAGATWHAPPSLDQGGVTALAFGPRDSSSYTIAAASDHSIAVSRDHGETWQDLNNAPSVPVLSLLFVGEAMLAGMYRRGVARSEDGGSTWQPSTEGLRAGLDTELVLSPEFARDRTLIVGGLEDGLRVSRDGGVTLDDQADDPPEGAVFGVAVSDTYAADATLFAATSAGIRVSRDAARTWQPCHPADGPARGVATGPGLVLAALEGGRLFASDGTDQEDQARTWRTLPSPSDGAEVIALAVSPAYLRDRTIFVATTGATELVLWRSIDGGAHWHRWLVDSGGGLGRMPLALPSTYPVDERVFAGLHGCVLRPLRHAQEVHSGERRPMWRSAQLGPATVAVTGLAISPNYGEDHTVFTTSNAGVFVSRNGGERFQPWNDGLGSERMVAVAVSPSYQVDRLVYGLGLGGTLWRRRDEVTSSAGSRP